MYKSIVLVFIFKCQVLHLVTQVSPHCVCGGGGGYNLWHIFYIFRMEGSSFSEGKGTSLDTTGIEGEMKEEGGANKDDYKSAAASKNRRE